MAEKLTKDGAVKLLTEKYKMLSDSGDIRYPKRSDFTDEEVNAIKAYLGPWPRALEAAGIKPPRDDGKAERTKEKRIRAKRKATDVKINKKEVH